MTSADRPNDLLTAILVDVAQHVSGGTPSSVVSSSVTWRDGSLGCPEPGMMYTQSLVAGYRVIVEARGQRFEYHADRNGRFVLCPPDRASEPVIGDAI